MTSQTPNVAIYVRVSTEEQAKEGLSVDAQIDKCQAFCKARGWEIYRVYKDAGFSAGKMERPAMELLLRDANEKKFQIILVYKIDRFSRKLKDLIMVLEDLKQKNINFTSVTEQIDTTSAMGEAFFQIIGVFAQLERGMVKERVKLAFERKIKLGESLNRAPFGYIYQNKKLVPDPENAQNLKEIFELWNAGINYKEICNKFGISKSSVYQIVKNPIYLGKIKYKDKLYKGKHKPLISEELFNEINKNE
ncbi:recombinase family protein [archaeon]|jgi:site-specific DNA recombinase|nr:recombinase family protein [archaeon]MBT4373064.1 recombinase family protein [archaeon]MBT4531409.1 recombinase family protein [archaeon]MBT7001413.1 recombinase family protein [archaeon]MBT7282101.1 recombinase family protein [archaeon]